MKVYDFLIWKLVILENLSIYKRVMKNRDTASESRTVTYNVLLVTSQFLMTH